MKFFNKTWLLAILLRHHVFKHVSSGAMAFRIIHYQPVAFQRRNLLQPLHRHVEILDTTMKLVNEIKSLEDKTPILTSTPGLQDCL